MAKINYPDKVPCISCGTMVEKKKVMMSVKNKQCEVIITDVPQYECTCGCLFIPTDAQMQIQALENIKNPPKGKVKITFSDLVRKGTKAIIKA